MKNLKQRVLVSCFFFFGGCYIPPLLAQQNVGIGTTTPDACAALEISSPNQGLLIPRMSTTSRLTISKPSEGLVLFDSTAHAFYYYSDSTWVKIGVAGSPPMLMDGDRNTQIHLKKNTNENMIRFDLAGTQKMALTQNSVDIARLEMGGADNGYSLYIGDSSGAHDAGGSSRYNVALGYKAGYANTSGRYNTFSGSMAGLGNNTGNYNTYSGYFAGYANATGSRNTGVGNSANSATTDNTNSTGIGYNADPLASNTIHIGNNSVTSIKGQVAFSTYSDARFKTNINEEEVQGLSFITALRPVTYTYDVDALSHWKETHYNEKDIGTWEGKYDIESIRFSGFIAQEVEALADSLGYAFSGVDRPKNKKDVYGLRYAAFVVPLVKAVQEQQARIQRLEERNRQLITELEAKQAVLDERLARVEGLLYAGQKTEKQ